MKPLEVVFGVRQYLVVKVSDAITHGHSCVSGNTWLMLLSCIKQPYGHSHVVWYLHMPPKTPASLQIQRYHQDMPSSSVPVLVGAAASSELIFHR